MNKIEQMFYDAFVRAEEGEENEIMCELMIQKPVGIYKPDFIYGSCVIEIDGHEYHKTKEQREQDYKRERYFIRQGYTVIRFMATEVYLDALKCVLEAVQIASIVELKSIHDWSHGYEKGKEISRKE